MMIQMVIENDTDGTKKCGDTKKQRYVYNQQKNTQKKTQTLIE